MDLTSIPVEALKKHQRKLFIGGMVVLLLFGMILFISGIETKPSPPQAIHEKAPIYNVTEAIDDKSFWVFKSEQRLAEQQKNQEKLMEDLEALRATLKKPEDDKKSEIELLQNRMTELENKLSLGIIHPSSEKNTAHAIPENALEPPLFNPDAFNVNTSHTSNPHNLDHKSLFSETIAPTLDNTKPKLHFDTYIPAGAYAKAVLLSGVDVSVGISSQSNPQPVLLRLIHPGSLPNRFIGQMKDCRIIAAASGELSSERAQFRLEKLSCIKKDGQVIETDVDGYISGEDGKNGMRGRMIMRDGEVLKRGFLGGLLSGLGKATSQSFNTTSFTPFGSVNTVKNGDIFKQAGAEGAGNAFELMARYNIQRAEQYQPVIQISAGREVFVVFHSGRAFGEERVKTNPKIPDPKLNQFLGENP